VNDDVMSYPEATRVAYRTNVQSEGTEFVESVGKTDRHRHQVEEAQA
jgi:hypothetical protein